MLEICFLFIHLVYINLFIDKSHYSYRYTRPFDVRRIIFQILKHRLICICHHFWMHSRRYLLIESMCCIFTRFFSLHNAFFDICVHFFDLIGHFDGDDVNSKENHQHWSCGHFVWPLMAISFRTKMEFFRTKAVNLKPFHIQFHRFHYMCERLSLSHMHMIIWV